MVITSGVVLAQAPTATPAFEVASIKPAAPQTGRKVSLGGMRGDPGRVSFTNISLRQLLERAYRVRRQQVAGPSWLDNDRFDIVAKLPEGAGNDQVPAMLQNLVIERFNLTLRIEKKEMPVYALVVAKNGPKLEKAADGDEPAPDRRVGITITEGQLPGFARMEGHKTTLSNFANMLSNVLDRPVVDQTELTGTYDFAFETDGSMFMKKGPMAGPGPEEKSGARGESGPAPDSTPSGSLFSDIQKIGLKLEPGKAPLDFIIIEKGERVPTAN
jgi:uncharacterized protein (TIGR03435 family)